MQKIQFYLATNRITVTTDLVNGGYNTEYRQVYQRKIKLYKGIDNTIELDIRNDQQRREDVIGKTADLSFFDVNQKLLFTAQGSAIPSKPGLMSVTIDKIVLEKLQPQSLRIAAKITQGVSENIIYADSQFGLMAEAEVYDGFNEKYSDVLEEITVFNYEYDRKEFISEIGNFGTTINDDYSSVPVRSLTAEFIGSYQGVITVEATKDKSTAIGTNWTKLEDWDAAETSNKTYTGDWRFIRFRHGGKGPGYGAQFTVTKVGGEYTRVDVIVRGQYYQIGDEIRIKGSYLGGDDGVNDLVITVNGTNESPPGAINAATITWSGLATTEPDSQYYRNIKTEQLNSTKPIDKIILRN